MKNNIDFKNAFQGKIFTIDDSKYNVIGVNVNKEGQVVFDCQLVTIKNIAGTPNIQIDKVLSTGHEIVVADEFASSYTVDGLERTGNDSFGEEFRNKATSSIRSNENLTKFVAQAAAKEYAKKATEVVANLNTMEQN